MGIYLERYNGPSKLDEQLEQFKDTETGDIIITPEQAREVLIDRLVAHLKHREGRIPAKIETLLRIAKMSEPEDRFDYAATLESVREEFAESREEAEKLEREMKRSNISISRGPSQPEI